MCLFCLKVSGSLCCSLQSASLLPQMDRWEGGARVAGHELQTRWKKTRAAGTAPVPDPRYPFCVAPVVCRLLAKPTPVNVRSTLSAYSGCRLLICGCWAAKIRRAVESKRDPGVTGPSLDPRPIAANTVDIITKLKFRTSKKR